MARLPILCPQEYDALTMRVTTCVRCENWADEGRCTVPTGAEHLPLEQDVPICPIQDRCQHQIQMGPVPCVVRARGLICESALVWSGMTETEAMSHPLGFSAMCVASPEELEMMASE
jgi:hypothetical protein